MGEGDDRSSQVGHLRERAASAQAAATGPKQSLCAAPAIVVPQDRPGQFPPEVDGSLPARVGSASLT